MLDSITSPHLSERQAWTTIHQDLTNHSQEFAELEGWFAELASAYGGVRLTRLRIHDIPCERTCIMICKKCSKRATTSSKPIGKPRHDAEPLAPANPFFSAPVWPTGCAATTGVVTPSAI
jgi:hypothetical protein